MAIFATEWGTCDASGDGTLNLEEASVRTCNESACGEFIFVLQRAHGNHSTSSRICIIVHLTNQPPFSIFSKSTLIRQRLGWTSSRSTIFLMPTGPLATSRTGRLPYISDLNHKADCYVTLLQSLVAFRIFVANACMWFVCFRKLAQLCCQARSLVFACKIQHKVVGKWLLFF